MITRRMRGRRRLLDTFVRLELEEGQTASDHRWRPPRPQSLRPRSPVGDERPLDGEDAQQERSA